MIRVLITRPEPGATQTAGRLRALGFFPVIAPLLSIAARDVRAPDDVAATLLTSRNAVAACPPSLRDRPIFAVGTATAACAAEAGFSRVFNADGDASALANLVADTLSPGDGSLLLPTGQGQGTELATSLRRRGFRVVRRVAYQAVGVSALPEVAATHLRQHQLAAALFFSAETARLFVRLVQADGLAEAVCDVEAVSISERTAVALRPLTWRRVSVAAKPNQDAMLALLK
ncbi:MAG: uroporphyrinogen-III synthase [Rhodopila sp.]|nr:uroporphyrinogen-III synthase [Rhodopila sp.]